MPGFVTTPAHRADGALPGPLRDLTDLELESRGARERVAPLVHRCRAGVRGLAAEGDLVALDAERAQDDAERQIERLEHGPLLDVELEVRGCAGKLAVRVERRVEVDTVVAERVRQRDPIRVLARPQLILVGHRAGRRGRAEERAAEPGAFLVGPVDESHGDRRRSLGRDSAQHLDAGHDVESAVQPAAVRHRVDVATDEDRLVGGAAQGEPLIARRVDRLLRPAPFDLASQPLSRALPGLRPSNPLRAVLVPGQLLELAKLVDGPAGLQRHAATLTVVSIARCPRSRSSLRSEGRVHCRAAPRAHCSCLVGLAALWGLWEGYRWLGIREDWTWPIKVNDTNMPHLSTIWHAFGQSLQPDGPPLRHYLWHYSLFTGKEALAGFALGAIIGFLLAVVLAHSTAAAAWPPPVHRRVSDRPDPRDRADGGSRARDKRRDSPGSRSQ